MSITVAELLNTPIPEKLWHYTSIEGFRGIVKGRSMRATDLRFLNDREEFIHARKIADKIVREAPELDASGFPYRRFLAAAVALPSGPVAKVQVFVACFTKMEDQLSQWRGYSHGSSGVSLAFDPRCFSPPPGGTTLASFAPCVYDTLKKQELILDALHHGTEEMTSYVKQAFETACERDPGKRNAQDKIQVSVEFLEANPDKKAPKTQFVNAAAKTSASWLRIAALLKHSAFHEEEEWRLVLPVMREEIPKMKNPPDFRIGKTTLIPYIAHPFSAPIVDVILGPGSDENSVVAAEAFLSLRVTTLLRGCRTFLTAPHK